MKTAKSWKLLQQHKLWNPFHRRSAFPYPHQILFYLLYKSCGFYTIILSNGISYFISFCIGLYYQKKYLNIRYYSNINILLKYCVLFLFYIAIGLSQLFIHHEITSIIFTTITVIGITTIAYKHLQIISMDDILRYFSENKFIISLYNKL